MSASRNQRPGGITALAILNFLSFGLGLMGLLGYVFLIVKSSEISKTPYGTMSNVIVNGAFDIVSTGLLLISGIGLLGCRKILGRYCTTVLCLVAIGHAVWIVEGAPDLMSLMVVASFTWNAIVAVLVNSVFKDDLVK